jgi:hypothetical protein
VWLFSFHDTFKHALYDERALYKEIVSAFRKHVTLLSRSLTLLV